MSQDMLADLARRLRSEADLMDVEGEGFDGTTTLIREAAYQVSEAAKARVLLLQAVQGWEEGDFDLQSFAREAREALGR